MHGKTRNLPFMAKAKTKKETHPKKAPAPVSKETTSSPEVSTVPIQPQKGKKTAKKQLRAVEKQRNKYSQSVYTSRFTHFRVLRISSWLIGTAVLVVLSFSLWRLYNTVFDTIENTEQLFFIQEVKKTDIIDFKTFEEVRDAAAIKYAETSTTTPAPIFGTAPTLDTEAQIVEE